MNPLSRLFMYGACIILVLFLFGCGTSTEDSSEDAESVTDSSTEEVDSEIEDVEAAFAEADEAALEFYRAFYEFNVPVLYEMLPPKQQDEFLDNGKIGPRPTILSEFDEQPEEFIDSENFLEIKGNYIEGTDSEYYIKAFFRDFEKNENYEMIRLSNAYEETGEVIYYVSGWDYENRFGYSFLGTKQNPEGEWKVIEVSDKHVGIDPKNNEQKEELEQIGVLLHPDDMDEDDYGF